MLKSPQAGLIGNLAPRQVLNRPYTVSEWNIGAWNEHLMEASFTMISCGLLQGWDGLIQFVLIPRQPPEEQTKLNNRYFGVGQNPSVVLQYPTLARIWHRQDIAEADPVFIRRIAPSQLNMPSAIPSRFIPEAFMPTFKDEIPEENEFGHMLAIVGKVGNEFVSKPEPHFEAKGISSYLDQEKKVAQSMNGELTWDWGQGYMLINTSKTQGVCGYIGGINITTETISIESSTNYGLIALTTLNDEESIKKSNHLLLTTLGRARNTGTLYGNAADRDKTHDRYASEVALPPEQRVAILELGEPPIITEPIKGKMTITMDHPENAMVFILDDLGNRGEKVASWTKAGKLEINLPGDHSARFFEIIIQ